MKRSWRRLIRPAAARPLLGTALALTALLVSAVPATALPGGGPRPVVTVAQGSLRGQERGGAQEFLGIPYAAPPVGAARLRAPQTAGPVARGAGGGPAGSRVPAVLPVRAEGPGGRQ